MVATPIKLSRSLQDFYGMISQNGMAGSWRSSAGAMRQENRDQEGAGVHKEAQ